VNLVALLVFVAAPPVPVAELDAQRGVTVTVLDKALLPSSRSQGGVADIWLVEVMTLQHGRGDVARFDPLRLSAHGRSYMQLSTTLNGLDITDPARPGEPLLAVPFEAWDSVTFTSLYTSTPGFHYRVAPREALTGRLVGGTGGDVGGGLLIPSGLMDREPATRAGAPTERRELVRPIEVTVDAGVGAQGGGVRVIGEHLEHRHHYLTLVDDEHAERSTALLVGRSGVFGIPLELTLGWQGERRSHAGAELRLPEPLTRNSEADALIAGISAELAPSGHSALTLSFGFGMRDDHEQPNTSAPFVTDLEDEWLYLGRPRFPETLSRSRADAAAVLRLGPAGAPLVLSARGSRATLTSTPTLVGGRSGITYDGVVYGSDSPAAAFHTVYGPARRAEETLVTARAEVRTEHTLGRWSLSAYAAWDHGSVDSAAGSELSQSAPAAGVFARLALGETELFATLSREPERMTSELAAAIDPARPSSYRYRWDDDGDLVPETGETGQLIARSGARFRTIDADLARPASNTLAVGITTPPFGAFKASFRGIGRLLTDRYVVRLTEASASAYSSRTFHDPGGDGRGEEIVPGGGQRFTIYDRDPASFGTDSFVLTNSARADFYWGLEAQLLSLQREPWFLSLSGTAYLSAGSAPFGSFPDRNDPGVIDEASADPNARAHNRGRYDHDRSYGLHLLAGWTPIEALWLSTALRYRDGQPFTRVVVADSLSQGPTALMAVRRGKPRHTFHMEMDVRAAYQLGLGDLQARLVIDVLNALGSGTELLEDPRTGPTYRDPIEMVPGRSVFATLELAF
jgi:hypothetical protein